MNRPQSWENCDKDLRVFVEQTVEILKENLASQVLGIYLHGSLTMGCYYRPKSDIDMLIVVSSSLSKEVAVITNKALAHHAEQRPIVGGLELSVITASTAKTLPSPMPYELHFSQEWHEKILNDEVEYSPTKTDLDLNSHAAYVINRGATLFGQPIEETFGEVNWDDFRKSILDDFAWIIEDEHILETPFYSVLNICRVFRYMKEPNHAFSKDEGGIWGLSNLPQEFQPLVQEALDVYHSSNEIDEKNRRTGGRDWDKSSLLSFRNFAKEQLGSSLPRQSK